MDAYHDLASLGTRATVLVGKRVTPALVLSCSAALSQPCLAPTIIEGFDLLAFREIVTGGVVYWAPLASSPSKELVPLLRLRRRRGRRCESG